MSALSSSKRPATNLKKAADLLLQAKVLTAEKHAQVVEYVQRTGKRSEEGMLDLGLLTETDLLKSLAAIYKTRFVTTEKLSKVDLPRGTLALIPKRVAETLGVLPVLFDTQTSILNVVSADPDNFELLQELKLITGTKDVKAFLARGEAIKAGIAKFHGGDLRAFEMLERANASQWISSTSPQETLDGIERFSTARRSERVAAPQTGAPPLPPPKRSSTPGARTETGISPGLLPPVPPLPPPGVPSATDRRSVTPPAHESMAELLSVLVSLLENSRQELRGHSAMVARLIRRAAERMNLGKEDLQAAIVAAYIHDLGKMGQFHLTALNCSEYEGHKVAAQKAHDTPLRLLEAVRLTPQIRDAVFHMYERFDGKGFPDGLSGKEIPLAARLIAIADTYADLSQNPRNPFRKQLKPQEACAVLAKYRGQIFDPALVDLFKSIMMGEDIRAKLLANRHVALVIDSDPEENTVLELRMIEQGFEVKAARTIDQARKLLQEGEFAIVVSEIDLPDGDGLALLAEARQQKWGKDVHWVFHTRRQGRTEAQRAFDLGALDFVSKPVSTDIFVAKLRVLLDQRQAAASTKTAASGVSGALAEMGLPDLVQVLFHGRKTGSLKIKSGQETGEIHFLNGAVAQATWGAVQGSDAFYAMCKLAEGEFSLDPTFKPAAVLIKESAEALLLEGMRRMDEGL